MIAVCGEALVDEIHLADGTVRVAPGGGPFNTARAVARLGVPAAFVGHLSKDEQGRDLAQLLGSDGVSLEYATFGPERTTVAVATLDVKGHAVYRFDVEGTSAPNLTPEMLPVHFAADVAALHVGSLGLVMEPMASTLVELVRREREGRLVMVDPNVRAGLVPDPVYRRRLREVIAWSSVVKASAEDLAWLYPDVDHRHAARNLAADGVALVVVTLGAGGAYGVHHEDEVGVAAKPVDVVDTVGAGDAFGAALLAWLHDHSGLSVPLRLERAQLLEALGFACAAAAVTCSRAGADPPWKRELVVSYRGSVSCDFGHNRRVRTMTGGLPGNGDAFDIPGVVSLAWDPLSRSVMVVWCGRATAHEFSALLDAELEALRANSSSHLLADLKRQPPIPLEAQDGADRDWLPRALAAGLKRFAVVLPDDREAAINIEDRLGRVSRDELEVGFFHGIDEARRWLTR